MSNVLSRHRSTSDLEFYKNAVEIRAELTRYFMSEKKVPKRWRFVFAMPGVDLARKLVEEIIAANTIYPTTEEEVTQRRNHQNEAIIACEQIIQHLQWLADTLPVSIRDFDKVVEKINKEVALLKNWRKQNKVLSHKKGYT